MSDNTTSTVRSLCPECNDNYVTTVRLKEGDVLVKCDCRTYYYYPLEEYLQIIEKRKMYYALIPDYAQYITNLTPLIVVVVQFVKLLVINVWKSILKNVIKII